MSAHDLPSFQWYPAHWMRRTRLLSLEAKGLWIEIINLAFFAPESGVLVDTLAGLASAVGAEKGSVERLISVLETKKICDVSRDCHGNVTIVVRRLVEQEKERQEWAKRKRKERASRDCHGDVTPKSQDSASASASAVTKSDSGCTQFLRLMEAAKGRLDGVSWENWKTMIRNHGFDVAGGRTEEWLVDNLITQLPAQDERSAWASVERQGGAIWLGWRLGYWAKQKDLKKNSAAEEDDGPPGADRFAG